MNPAAKIYPDQFATTPDLLHVAIPRMEIIAEMSVRGEQETLDDIWCLLACRQAVKAGEELAPDEAVQLIAAWSACREPHHCPHGRPTQVSLELAELERMFKR